jgi:hypothetical protein
MDAGYNAAVWLNYFSLAAHSSPQPASKLKKYNLSNL